MSFKQVMVVGVCAVAVLMSSIGVTYAKYISRKEFLTLQALRVERDELEVEWRQLQLEQSTWATHGHVERVAREQLQMHIPVADEVVVIRP